MSIFEILMEISQLSMLFQQKEGKNIKGTQRISILFHVNNYFHFPLHKFNIDFVCYRNLFINLVYILYTCYVTHYLLSYGYGSFLN